MATQTDFEPHVGTERNATERIGAERAEDGRPVSDRPEPDPSDRGSDASITRLLSGIAEDAQALLQQQLTLFQVELKNDLRRTRNAAIPLMAGVLVCGLAVIFICAMLALLLDEALVLPRWGGFAGVGGTLLVVGVAMVLWGKSRFDAFNPLPDQTVEGIKETIQWKTKK
jgi:uncharacterized membrane protein YqjE